MNRRRGKIVQVGIVIMIVIVMLSGGGGENSLELVAVRWWGGATIV